MGFFYFDIDLEVLLRRVEFDRLLGASCKGGILAQIFDRRCQHEINLNWQVANQNVLRITLCLLAKIHQVDLTVLWHHRL